MIKVTTKNMTEFILQVRSLWLELIIDGLMKDYETKMKLSVIFAQNYPEIVEDYYCDDQERESSIMSLSVQIFTVPSIAHHLIESCDAMAKMLQGETSHGTIRDGTDGLI